MLQCNMQHNPTQTTFHPLLPTPLALTLTSFPAVHLSQYVAVTHESLEIVSLNASSVHMVELTIPLETGAENAGAMKQIRNAELVDSGTQDGYQATHNR